MLVNNAGVSCIRRAQDTSVSVDQFRRVLEVNLLGAFIAARAAGSAMLAQCSGSIVNIAPTRVWQVSARGSCTTLPSTDSSE